MSVVDRLKNPIMRLYVTEILDNKSKAKELQKALVNLGQNIQVDGKIGPITITAIKRVNNKKLAKEIWILRSKPGVNPNYPKWLKIAIEELGTKEILGKASNPRVEQYHAVAGLPWAKDDIPWCASFVAFCMKKSGYSLPKYPARALSWLHWGVSAHQPVLGAIAVKKRKGGGHVTFVVGMDGDYLYCLGGNQHDAVRVSKYRRDIFIDFRVPADYKERINPPKWKGIASLAGKES